MATVQRYNLAQIVYEDQQITTDTFKTTRRQDIASLATIMGRVYVVIHLKIDSKSSNWFKERENEEE